MVFMLGAVLVASWYYAINLTPQLTAGRRQSVSAEMYPLWNGSRAVLHHVDPYSDDVTRESEMAMYGPRAESLVRNHRELTERFVYPVYAAVTMAPLALLSFHAANVIAFYLFAALAILSVGWLREKWDRTTWLYVTIFFSTFPLGYDLLSRQPTLLFFGLVIVSLSLFRSNYPIAGGILAALSSTKPQVALPILLPILIWSAGERRRSKRFVASCCASLLVLLAWSSVLVPGWIPRWLAAMRSYSQYVPNPSIAVSVFGPRLGLVVSGLLLIALVGWLWLHPESSLWLRISLSVLIFQLLVPYATYNAVLLLIPSIWLADNSELAAAHGLPMAFVRVSLIGVLACGVVGALLFHTTGMGILIAWQLPEVMTRIYLASLVVTIGAHLYHPEVLAQA
jgi:hypothetical protein